MITLRDLNAIGFDDPAVLRLAADQKRILLTHDRATMPDFAFRHLAAGHPLPGLFIIPDRMPVGAAIDEILLISTCTEPSEWEQRIVYLPIK